MASYARLQHQHFADSRFNNPRFDEHDDYFEDDVPPPPPPMNPHERPDIEAQRAIMMQHRRESHEKWVAEHLNRTKFDIEQNRARASILVTEAWELERTHLQHQIAHAKKLVRRAKKNRTVGATDSTPPMRGTRPGQRAGLSPLHNNQSHSPDSCGSPDCGSPEHKCACTRATVCRLITPKYRAMALLKSAFDQHNVEEAVETLRPTYATDHEMLDDLMYRYGPEEDETVSPNTRLACAEEKMREVDEKWRAVGRAVEDEMRHRDSYATVIRNLSIMRIFLEGSQAPVYGCDTSERSRRDALHQQVLDRLATENQLFTPARRR